MTLCRPLTNSLVIVTRSYRKRRKPIEERTGKSEEKRRKRGVEEEK